MLPLVAGDGPAGDHGAGRERLRQYLPTRTFELVVHGVGIARPAGLPVPAYGAGRC